MVKVISTYVGIAAVALFVSCGNTPVQTEKAVAKQYTAAEYNDVIVGEQKKILGKVPLLVQKINEAEFEAALKDLDTYIAQCDASIAVLEGLGSYKGDDEYRTAALDCFKYYKQSFATDWKRMIALWRKEQMTPDEEAELENIQQNMDIEEAKYDKARKDAERGFATKYHIALKEE